MRGKIIEIAQMKGSHAYANYCAAITIAALPGFCDSLHGLLCEAWRSNRKEQEITYDGNEYEQFVLECLDQKLYIMMMRKISNISRK